MKLAGRKLVASAGRYRRAAQRSGFLWWPRKKLARLEVEFWNFVAGADIDPRADLATDVVLPHPTGVVVHENAVVGQGCMIMQQVTLGQLAEPDAPVVGSNVYIGAGAKVLGGVRIGDGARIGANAVVLCDIPRGATAVGVPARIARSDGGV
jgi:serine O-acetyltransferase